MDFKYSSYRVRLVETISYTTEIYRFLLLSIGFNSVKVNYQWLQLNWTFHAMFLKGGEKEAW